MQTLKARGTQGSWFARIGDDDVPCVWMRWRSANHYKDPGATISEPKWARYVETICAKKIVALTHERIDEAGKWFRDGYVGLFEVDNVICGEDGLEFDFVKRVAHLK